MENFLNKLYSLDKISKDRALDLLFETVDEFCWDGRFDVVDKLLQEFDLDVSSLTLAVGLLSITYAAKEHLPTRSYFYRDVFSRAEKMKGILYATNLLKGLE